MTKVFYQITPYSIEDWRGRPVVYNNAHNSAAVNVFLACHSSSANEGHLPRNLAWSDNENGLKTSVCFESCFFGQI